jgi:hypothetical protein
LIVVEGVDGSGKSTLCSWITDNFGLRMGQRSIKNRDEIYRTTRLDTWRAVYRELACNHPPLVWDRLGPFSDPIYAASGIPHERYGSFTSNEIEMFDHIARAVALVIVCVPPLQTVMDNLTNTHQLDRVIEKTPDIYAYYLQLADEYNEYDYTRDHPSVLTPLIAEYLYSRREREELAAHTRQL